MHRQFCPLPIFSSVQREMPYNPHNSKSRKQRDYPFISQQNYYCQNVKSPYTLHGVLKDKKKLVICGTESVPRLSCPQRESKELATCIGRRTASYNLQLMKLHNSKFLQNEVSHSEQRELLATG